MYQYLAVTDIHKYGETKDQFKNILVFSDKGVMKCYITLCSAIFVTHETIRPLPLTTKLTQGTLPTTTINNSTCYSFLTFCNSP